MKIDMSPGAVVVKEEIRHGSVGNVGDILYPLEDLMFKNSSCDKPNCAHLAAGV